MSELFWQRVDERRKELGLSQQGVSLSIGMSRDWLRLGKRQNSIPRGDRLDALAELLGCAPDYLLGRTDDATPTTMRQLARGADSVASFIRLPIAHRVEAGSWHEVGEVDEPLGWRTVPAHPSFPHARQWLEEVVGDSMDLLIRPGSLVHVIDIEDAGYVPVDGDIVVVVRTRAGFLERTLKQLVIERADDGRMIRSLVPRSNNPRYTAPVMREGDDPDPGTEQVEIVGLVVQDFRIWK